MGSCSRQTWVHAASLRAIHDPQSVDLLSAVVYADFLVIVAVNISLLTHAHPQNTYYQLPTNSAVSHKRACSADSVWSPSSPIAIRHPSQPAVNKHKKCHWPVMWFLFNSGSVLSPAWMSCLGETGWPLSSSHLICFSLFHKVKPNTGRDERVCLLCEITVFYLNEVFTESVRAVVTIMFSFVKNWW